MRGTKARAHAKSGKWPVYKRAVVRARSCATKDSEDATIPSEIRGFT